MILSMAEQSKLFAVAVLTGFVGGCVYELFALVRKIITHGFWLVQAEDFIFWVLFSIAFFLIYYKINFADIREFNFLGVAVGMSVAFILCKNLQKSE